MTILAEQDARDARVHSEAGSAPTQQRNAASASAATGQSPVAAQIIQRVTELSAGFRTRTAVTEQERTVPRESIDELLDAGVARMLVPAERGGLDLRIRDLMDVTVAAARGCPSTGWLTGLMCAVAHTFALFPLEAQQAVWADGPDVIGAASIGLKATPVSGGYRVSGASPFASGVNNAEWVYIIGGVSKPSGPPEMRIFLLPRSDYTISDTWQTTGMRGTGSNTVITEDVFVGDAFTISQVDARDGTTPGAAINANPSFKLPWAATGSLTFAAAMLGATEAAFDEVVEILARKRTPSGVRIAENEIIQMQIAFVSARITMARKALCQVADRADADPHIDVAERAQGLRDMAFSAVLLKECVDVLMDICGTSGFATSTMAQQAWRDVNFAAAHQGLNSRTWGAYYGKILLDVTPAQQPLFF